MANFTPQEIEQFLQEFFDVVGARQYVGARYVPIFGRAGESTVDWDDGAPYEPLTVVMHEGVSYVSRRYVPNGVQITDTAYWVETYRFNAQVEQYRQEVLAFDGRIDDAFDAIDALRGDVASDYVPFPDSAHYPKYGTSGQVLSTLADGTTEWVDPVVPSDSQAETVITAWLDDHPEATTTVQDGAITTAKLANGAVTDAKLAASGGVLDTVAAMGDKLKRTAPQTYQSIGSYTIDRFDLVQGTHDTSDPELIASSTTRLRPVSSVRFNKGDVINFTGGTVVNRLRLERYGLDRAFVEEINLGAEYIGYLIPNDGYYVLSFRNSDNATLLPTQYDAVTSLEPSFYNRYDFIDVDRLLTYGLNDSMTAVDGVPRPNLTLGVFDANGYSDSTTRLTAQRMEHGIYSITTQGVYEFMVYKYISDASGEQYLGWRQTLSDKYFDDDIVLSFRRHDNLPITTADIYNIYTTMTISRERDAYEYISGEPTSVLRELYVIDNSYTPYGIMAYENMYRFKMRDANSTNISNGLDVNYKYYSGKIQRFVDTNTNKIVAYYILEYNGTDYAHDSNTMSLTASAYSLDDNPRIKEYLGRDGNLVLIGDSIFGYKAKNVLEALLSTETNKKVYNCGFGGCRMAWRTADGSSDYDKFSFSDVMDVVTSTASDRYDDMEAAIGINNAYPYRLASLREIDWTKPTTVLVNYVNNDITGASPIGDLWAYTDQLADFDRTTFLGALNYGLYKLLTAYPHVNVIEFTSAWRTMGSNEPPYVYENTLNLSADDYDNAIKSNADRLGLAVYDFFRLGGRNWLNTGYYQQDASHYNEYGFGLLAQAIGALDESFVI